MIRDLKIRLEAAFPLHVNTGKIAAYSIIEDHAKHHEGLLNSETKRREKKRADTMDQAMLTMVQQVAALPTSAPR
ncbi:hypothetical protein AOLI_G00183680 [Acnodon oligacanthus]